MNDANSSKLHLLLIAGQNLLAHLNMPNYHMEHLQPSDVSYDILKHRHLDLIALAQPAPCFLDRLHFLAVPIVALVASEAEGQRLLKAGAVDFLLLSGLSTITPALLNHFIYRAIERYQLLIELQHRTADLQTTEASFRYVIEKTPDAVLIVNQEGIIRFANPAGEALFSCHALELVGAQLGFPCVAGEVTEIDVLRRDEPCIVVEMRVTHIQWEGKPAYLASFRDISTRKQRERALQFQANILAQIHDAVFLLDENLQVTYANHNTELLLGMTENKFQGKRLSEILDLTWVDPPSLQKAIAKLEREKTISMEVLLRREGESEEIYVEATVSQMADEADIDSIHYLMVARDMTDRKRTEQQAIDIALEKEKVVMLKNFIGEISHDFRTPLTIFNTSLYILSRTEDPIERKARLRGIQEQLTLLNKMVVSMLSTASLDSDNQLNRQHYNLNKFLETVAAGITTLASQKGQTVLLDLDEALTALTALFDREAMQRVMTNLLENAMRYTPENGTITITSALLDDEIHIGIQDTGMGIPEEELPYIFDRFYRSESARDAYLGGSGLGLFIVKKLIELHQGTITVTSEPGNGTTFTLTLPFSRAKQN